MSRVYFTDRDLGKQFPDVLDTAGILVRRHADHFPPDCPDETWLRVIGERGWIAVTHNSRIRYTPNELQAVMTYAVALLVVIGHARYAELAHSFVATMPRIEAFLDAQSPPLIAKIYRASPAVDGQSVVAPGRIELWHPKR